MVRLPVLILARMPERCLYRVLVGAAIPTTKSVPDKLMLADTFAGQRSIRQRQQHCGTSLAARRAEYDDDEDWDDGPVSLSLREYTACMHGDHLGTLAFVMPLSVQGLGIVPGILGGAMGAIGSLTDLVARNTPASVSRGVVRMFTWLLLLPPAASSRCCTAGVAPAHWLCVCSCRWTSR